MQYNCSLTFTLDAKKNQMFISGLFFVMKNQVHFFSGQCHGPRKWDTRLK